MAGPEEKSVKEKMREYLNDLRKSDKSRERLNYLWEFRIEILSGILMLLGIILAFFFVHIGGALIGLAAGICFYKEIVRFFIALRHYYPREGIFKTVMVIAIGIFLILTLPAFIIALLIGFTVMMLISKRKS